MATEPRPEHDAEDDAPRSARPRRMLTEKQVLEIVPVSRRTLFRMLKDGEFPKPVFPSPNRRFWYETEIVAWQRALDEHGRQRRLRRASGSKF
ncbi:helix-turn-helix transcriptional regulator [Bradyrhizobium yuanmingense]|nr:AlpA family phage regulatory protein [Bradyrhizobium yuanmingense]